MPCRPTDFASVVVVESREQAEGLTRIGIPATTFRGILAASDLMTMTSLGRLRAVLYPTPATEGTALLVANRLGRLAIPVRVVSEPLDKARR